MTAPAGRTAARCGSGGSTHPQLDAALREATRQALVGLDGRAADLGVVFVSSAHGTGIRAAFESLADVVPARTLIGGTAEGVLTDGVEHESGPAVALRAEGRQLFSEGVVMERAVTERVMALSRAPLEVAQGAG